MGTYPPQSALALCTIPSQSAIGQWDWGFHTVRDCFDLGDLRFRPQVVGVVQVLKNLLTGDMETYPARGVLALFTIPSQSATGEWG